jgi:hypothetical protein
MTSNRLPALLEARSRAERKARFLQAELDRTKAALADVDADLELIEQRASPT